MMILLALSGCKEPRQVIYEGKGLIITGKKLGDKPERGKYVYYTQDQSGPVTVWSNNDFNLGDTLLLSKK